MRADDRYKMSAQPPAKKTAGQIEKETVPFWPSLYKVSGFRVTGVKELDGRSQMTENLECGIRN